MGRSVPTWGRSGPKEGRSGPSVGQSSPRVRQSSNPFRQTPPFGGRPGPFQGRSNAEREHSRRCRGRPGGSLGGSDDLLGRRWRDEAPGSRDRPRRAPATCSVNDPQRNPRRNTWHLALVLEEALLGGNRTLTPGPSRPPSPGRGEKDKGAQERSSLTSPSSLGVEGGPL
jgi:hypothetical protein